MRSVQSCYCTIIMSFSYCVYVCDYHSVVNFLDQQFVSLLESNATDKIIDKKIEKFLASPQGNNNNNYY